MKTQMLGYKPNQTIHFRLDGNPAHEGTGTFIRYDTYRPDMPVIKLNQNTKDFLKDTHIVIDPSEVI
jgi:hypothetical protein